MREAAAGSRGRAIRIARHFPASVGCAGSVRMPSVLIAWPLLLLVAGLFAPSALALNVERLDPPDSALLHSVLARLQPLIDAKKADGTANRLTWEELYQPLTAQERAFVDEFRALKAESLGATSHYFGDVRGAALVPVGPHAQTLPQDVYDAYERMMRAMEQDLGVRLLVESGYRAPAYQLYLFLFYLPTHEHSVRQTNRHVALPGYSEHGNPARQAVDFITQDGINGEERPEEFEARPEYAWLQRRAAEFGFYLSYPRDNPHHTAFEPWHWHYESDE